MTARNRTVNSLRNSLVATCVFCVNLILQFISRKVFIEYLGTEVLGLNTTATSILQFLNLAELGIGAAVTFTLYEPLKNKDFQTINEIVSLQGWLYRKIATFVVIGGIIIMFFFPLLFAKANLPLWYAYGTFSVLLFSSLLSYFVNYKQIVLSANQEDYKIQYSYKGVLLIKLLIQIGAVKYFEDGYFWWLMVELLFAILSSISLNYVIKKSAPYLSRIPQKGVKLKEKYPVVIIKIKQFFFHKIAGFVLTQTSPLIIYGFTSLSIVALYGNYLIIVNGLTSLLIAVFNGIGASVGNLVAEKNKGNTFKVFKELLVTRFFFVGICCYSMYTLTEPFIKLWLGAEFVMDRTVLILVVITFFINTIRSVVDSFINAFGLFRDIWAPLVEATLNIGLSIAFGCIWGLNGILFGVICSLVVIVCCWKPYFLFTRAMEQSFGAYMHIYLKLLMILVVTIFFGASLFSKLDFFLDITIFSFIGYGFLNIVIYGILLFILLYIVEPSMRSFTKRFIK